MGTSTTAASSTAAGGGFGGRLCLPSRTPIAFVGLWAWATGPVRGPSERAGHASAAAAASSWREDRSGGQDHYEVLGLPRSASNTAIKRAYRLLARKYHPDVNKNLQAGEVFKSIRNAYEVLSDEDSRARYDMKLRFVGHTERTWRRSKSQNFEDDERKRIRRWAELKQRMWNERQNKAHSQYYTRDRNQKSSHYDRGGPFIGVLRFTFLILFLMKTIGYQASLTVCSAIAFLDNRLDAGYKTGYLIAWFMGGQAGIMLSILIRFASWLCGKNSSNLVAVVVIAMWIGSNLARITPLPQGAVLALLYMSIKFQADLK